MPARPVSHYLAPALLASSAVLVAVNWYYRPEKAASWAAVAALLFVVVGVWTWMTLAPPRSSTESARKEAVDAIVSGIVFAGAMLTVSLSLKLAATLGLWNDADVSRRSLQALLGLFVAFTGNSIPKKLTPLSAMRCDGARVQAFQRLAGWTWVLGGIAYALVWLAMPMAIAKPVSMAVLVGSMVLVLTQLLRLYRTKQRAV
jgi:hypothetical protein